MIKKMRLLGLILGVTLTWQLSVRAEELSQTIGQVTIVNVDKSDSSVKLNGAQVKVVNQETGVEYVDTIQYNGTVVFELPLGKYSLQQMSAPSDTYELNPTQHDLNLQIPAGTNADTVKTVHSTITLTNTKFGDLDSAEPVIADVNQPTIQEQTAPGQTVPEQISFDINADPVTAPELISADLSFAAKNPETADFSWVTYLMIVISTVSIGIVFWFIRGLKKQY